MPRGRKPRPTALHRLHGTFNATRHRDRLVEPAAPELKDLEPPADLLEAEKASWRHAVENAPHGVLRAIDRTALRIWVETEERYRRARVAQAELNARQPIPDVIKTPNGSLQVSPYVAIQNRTAMILLKTAEMLGFVPVSRPRLAPHDDGDPEEKRWIQVAAFARKASNSR